MMIIDDPIQLNLLLASNVLLLGATAILLLRLQHVAEKEGAFWDSPTGFSMQGQAEQRELLKEIDQRFSVLIDVVHNLSNDKEPTESSRGGVPYDNAVRMAKHGATLDDLTRTCGLNANEARLLMQVHSGSPEFAKAS